MTTTPDAPRPPDATAAEAIAHVRLKAATGALLIAARTLGIRGLSLVGSVILARLLTPADFGIVALGYVVMSAGSTLTDGGLGAALVRGPIAPSREQLAAVTGFQLAGTLGIVAITGVVSALVGGHALITLVMVCSLPVLTLQTPAAIVLERDLLYRQVVLSDLCQTIVYTVWAVGTVAIFGIGVWGLASATVVSALAATIIMSRLAPIRFVIPTLDLGRVRSLLGFGVRFQAIDIVGLLRDQGLNSITGAIGGLGTLGLWSLTYRLLQPGMLVFDTLRRVSYPGMARLRDLGDDSSRIVVQALAMTCVAGSFVLAPLAASARALVPTLFGARWGPCADTLTMAAWAMLPTGALSVAASGYLLARGNAGDTLWVVIAHTVIGLVVAGALLPTAGIDALGYAQIAMAGADVVFFSAALRRYVPDFNPADSLIIPVFVSTVGTAAGWLVTEAIGRNLVAVVGGASVALVVVFAGHWLTARPTLQTLRRTATRAARSAASAA